MKRLLTIAMAALVLGLGGAASAQTTTMRSTHVGPNGAVQTTRTVTPEGTSTTRAVERDGTRVVTRSHTDVRGDRVSYRDRDTYRHGGGRMRVCHTHWRHHHRQRFCTWQYGGHHHHHDGDHDHDQG